MLDEKKKVIIIAPYMKMGGVEISLLRILKYLDYEKLEVTLLLTQAKGPLLSRIPDNIIVKEMEFKSKVAEFLIADYKVPDQETFLVKFIRKVLRKLINLKSYISKTEEKPLFNFGVKHTEPEKIKYDLAIDYHGYGSFPTAYTAKNVNATRKVMWIHDEKMDFLQGVSYYLNDFDKFYGVANSCVEIFKNKYPMFSERAEIFYNIVDINEIIEKASEEINDSEFVGEEFKIVTVGRLSKQKGYDIAIKAAKIMKDLGYEFKWFVIGEGKERVQLERLIKVNDLSNNFILLGLKKNPFPYIKASDLYVQPSRHEGYGLAIAEARVLEKPIIATKIDCVMEQITHGFNGYLVELNEMDLSNKIIDLIDNPLKKSIVIQNLKENQNDYINQLEKIYSM